MDFGDSADVGSSSEVDLAGKGNIDDFFGGLGHDFLDTCMHDVFFSGALQQLVLVDGQSGGLVDDIKQVVLCFFLPFAAHSAGIDVFQVFEPFEVADCHTASVAEHIG